MPKSRSRRKPQRRPVQRRSGQQRQVPTVPRPTAPGFRGTVERRSASVLTWFASRSPMLLPALAMALLLGGFLAPLVIAIPMLVVLLLVVAWLTYLSWPAVLRGGRLVRVATVVLLAFAIVSRVAGG